MGKLALLLSHTVNSPVPAVKRVVTRGNSQILRCAAQQQGCYTNPSLKQTLTTKRLSEPGGHLSPAVQCSGTESQWSPSPPARPASLCHPSPQCTATRAGQEGPACSAAVSNPVGDRRGTTPVSKAWHSKRGFKLQLRSLKMPF